MNPGVIPLLQLAAGDIARVEELVQETLEENAFAGFYPELMFRTQDEWPFNTPGKNQRLAMAARNAEGQTFLLINTDGPPKDLDGLLQHEIAHLLAWEKHGEKIREHGPEFRNVCRTTVKNGAAKFCKDR